MGTLTSCIAKAGKALHKEDKAALLKYAGELRAQGVENSEAAIRASERLLKELRAAYSAEAAVPPSEPSLGQSPQSSATVEVDATPTAAPQQATHTDPGEKPEPATQSVIKESLDVAAKNEGRKPSAMMAELLAMIDEKLKEAPDYPQFLDSVKRIGEKDAVTVWTKMGERHAPADYSRPMVTFDVKGDGKFTVNNTVRSLLTFRKTVAASSGFKDYGQNKRNPKALTDTVRNGSGSPELAVVGMIEEGDFELAVQFAEDQGVDLGELKLPQKYRDEFDAWTARERPNRAAQVNAARRPDQSMNESKEPTAAPEPEKVSETRPVDYKGFSYIPKGNGVFELRDGNLTVRVVTLISGLQARYMGAKSTPTLDYQGAVDWAEAIREDSIKARRQDEQKANAPVDVATEAKQPDRAEATAQRTQEKTAEQAASEQDATTYNRKITELGQSVQPPPVGAQYANLPTEQSTSERPDIGKQWDAMNQDRRHAVAALAGWATASGKVNPQGKAISRKTWADQIETTRARLAGALEKGNDPGQSNIEPTADRLEQEAQLWGKLTDGTATVDEFKAGFDAWVRDKDAIVERLNKLTKAQLLEMGSGQLAYRHKTSSKPEIVQALWAEGVAKYGLGRTISYIMAPGRNGYQDAVAKMVATTGIEHLKTYSDERKRAIKEADERADKRNAALKDPKTLDDFHVFLRADMASNGKSFKEARLGMSPEQRAKFDELSAESTREQREANKRALKTELKTSSEAVGGQVIETKHTQKGHDLFVVQLEKRIDRADYDRINASAKKLGGFYSSFRGRGAVPGFQFRDKASADAFLRLASGDTADAKAIADQRRDAFEDDKNQSAAERLTEMADKLESAANTSMAVERKQNTARRARFAAAAEREASRQKAMAATMRSLAGAISEGQAKFLDAVRQKVQVEFLERAVATAKDAEQRTKYQSYAEQQRHAGEPATSETADFADFPSYTAMRSDLASLGRQLLEVDGTKKLGQQIMKVADDVTDAFKTWAEEGANLMLLKAFSQKGTSKAAEFPTEKATEDAIARSGYKGRAIPWQIKRGQWTVIYSPSEAMQRGVWQGDGDKKITLAPEFGAELVEQIGKTARRGSRVSVPWQFESAYDRRKALSRMGIETPAEYRSALREFINLRQTPAAPSKLKELERAMVGRNNDGLDFFPTPAETVDAMIDAAEIEPGMRVLEPSAGWGHIAERLASVGASPEVVELSTDRRELLAAKGFNVVGSDFMEFTDTNHAERGFTFGDVMEAPDGTRGVLRSSGGMGSGRVTLVADDADGRVLGHFDFTDLVGVERRGVGSGYDRILMNPPFSDRRDAAHVQHAYSLLNPGGRLVAIMGEGVFFGQDKRAEAFRTWLNSVGGTSEKLAEGTFNDPTLPVNTSVNARMVVIEKPGSVSEDSGDGVLSGRGQPTIDVDGKQLPTSNTLGQRIHPTDEGLRNFWRWFGDSKMVDGQGRPRVFYHGAPSFEGNAFTFKEPGNSESKDQMFWFSDSPAVASSYALGDDGAQVIPTYIKAGNPSTVNAAGRVEEEIFGTPNKYFDSYASEAKSNGFDAYVILQANESLTGKDGLSDVVVVFKPDQIKSATGNSGAFDPKNEGLIFSRDAYIPPASSEKASPRQLEAFASSVSSKWAGGPAGGVRVIKSTDDLPESLRRWVASADADGVAQGFFYPEDESVYLIANRIDTIAQAQFVLFHEVYGHHGLRSVLGSEYASTMTMLAKANPALANMASGWLNLYGKQEVAARVDAGVAPDDAQRDVRLLATEEAFSDWAGTAPQVGRFKMLVARIQRGLRAIGLDAVADWLEQRTDAEVLDLLRRARRAVESGGTRAPRGTVAASRPDSPTIDVDGTPRPVTNARGQRIHPTDEGLRNFWRWFGDSKVVDEQGRPLVVYHGTAGDFDSFDPGLAGQTYRIRGERGIFFTTTIKEAGWAASDASDRTGGDESIMPVYLRATHPVISEVPSNALRRVGSNGTTNWYDNNKPNLLRKRRERKFADSIIVKNSVQQTIVVFSPTQIKSAIGNSGAFDPKNPSIIFSRPSATAGAQTAVKDAAGKFVGALQHVRGGTLQFLGRRQLVDLFGKDLPQLGRYSDFVQRMDAEKTDAGAEADAIADRWGKLPDERQLAELMHDATLAEMDADPQVAAPPDADAAQLDALRARFAILSPEAQKIYREARQTYEDHYAKVRAEIRARIERGQLGSERKRELIARLEGEFFKKVRGVYFPLARFGDYIVVVKDANGETVSSNRAETVNEANALRAELVLAYPGHRVSKVFKAKEFNAVSDGVGRGFMGELFSALEGQGVGAEVMDSVAQLYLASLPELSWAKHGIHRKGTPGFSTDARRAFAQNVFHGARYLARLKYGDQLQNELESAQKHVDEHRNDESFDAVEAQQVVDELNKRHELLMNPKTHPLSTALTSVGFVFHLGLSPASAMVNLLQTPLVAYPMMGAKWGFTKAGDALLRASNQAVANRNDISKVLRGDELAAYERAVRDGVIDVTMAHDLAGIAAGDDSRAHYKLRPVMKAAGFLFHHAERFNRQATFVAAYRLAREAGATEAGAYNDAVEATYAGHFDYSQGNRPRIMQGNIARVVTLFKQFGQNMVYTLWRQAYLAVAGGTPEQKNQARKAFGGLFATHAAAAGLLGLPLVGPMLAVASFFGSDDDQPWDAETAVRNYLADELSPEVSQVVAKGLSRLTPWDISGRVGLDRLLIPEAREGAEGVSMAESWATAALGPVAGIGVNMARGLQLMAEGHPGRGLEAMLPSALRGPVKAVRFQQEGALDKSGIVIDDDVSAAGVFGQAAGFAPTEVSKAMEGRWAITKADRALMQRRQWLMSLHAMAVMAGDDEGAEDIRKDVARFNVRNPDLKITRQNLRASVLARKRRIAEAQQGVYLPERRREALEAGRFAHDAQ